MALREEKVELRAKCHMLERDKVTMELRLSGHEAHRQAQGAALHSLQQQHFCLLKDDDDGQSKELMEVLAREARLKDKLQEMMSSLELVSRSADLKLQQSNEMIADMKRANSSLTQMLDKCKRKYQARIRKLEHQAEIAVDRHTSQVCCYILVFVHQGAEIFDLLIGANAEAANCHPRVRTSTRNVMSNTQ
jgi:hypothetical protein